MSIRSKCGTMPIFWLRAQKLFHSTAEMYPAAAGMPQWTHSYYQCQTKLHMHISPFELQMFVQDWPISSEAKHSGAGQDDRLPLSCTGGIFIHRDALPAGEKPDQGAMNRTGNWHNNAFVQYDHNGELLFIHGKAHKMEGACTVPCLRASVRQRHVASSTAPLSSSWQCSIMQAFTLLTTLSFPAHAILQQSAHQALQDLLLRHQSFDSLNLSDFAFHEKPETFCQNDSQVKLLNSTVSV